MTDRELLELAAKAAGYDAIAAMYGWDEIGGGVLLDANDPPEVWNPLTDDGDAFRLAVTCRVSVDFWSTGATVTYEVGADLAELHEVGEPHSATRRAIVRAAAEIARSAA